MGVLFDYFVAPSDAAAAATIDWVGGPDADGPEATRHGYASLAGNGIDPVVMLGKLECLMTGRSLDDVLADIPSEPLAIRDGGERVVLPIRDDVTAALADLDANRIPALAALWIQIEEFGGHMDVEIAASFLVDLCELSAGAQRSGQHLYSWMCV